MIQYSLFNEVKVVLQQLFVTIQNLTKEEYNFKHEILNFSSIGEHTRHIIEFFIQLENGYVGGQINYDERIRNQKLQEDLDYASDSIAIIIEQLEKPNKNLQLITLINNNESKIETNFIRELMYNLEHCIHHQAIIKIALQNIGLISEFDNFGISKSTIEYKIKEK